MKIKSYLVLMGLGFFTLSSIAQNTDKEVHTQIVTAVPVPEGNQSSGIMDLEKQYYADGSLIRKKDRGNLALKDSDIAIHLFQLGPKNETAFPEFDLRSGPNCEKRQPLEFAVRWEKTDGQSLPDIAEVSLLVGPSFSYKDKTDPETGLRVKVTTEPILGQMGLSHLDAGSMSLSYASDVRLKELIDSGRVKVTPILNQQSGAIEKYQITPYTAKGQALPSTYQPAKLNEKATLYVNDPDMDKTVHSATLMPYAIFFAPRHEGFLETRIWAKIKPYGTAIHGADLEHITPRNRDNLGSAGCARVQNHFANNTFRAIQQHLLANGAQFSKGGSAVDVYDKAKPNKAVGQDLIDSPQNAANLAAFLKSREKISIQGYMAATPTQMLQYYHSALTAQWKIVLSNPVSPNEVGPLGQKYFNALSARSAYAQLTNDWNAAYQQAKSDYESSGNRGQYQRLQQISQQRNQALNQAYYAADQSAKQLMASLEELDSTRRSTLPKEFQKLMAIRKKIQEYQPLALDPKKAHEPLAKMDDETYQFYANRMNRSKLYSKTAEAMERYYSDTYGQRIPQACMATVQLYRQRAIEFAQGLPPRAEPVE